jgi:hypothetical protein
MTTKKIAQRMGRVQKIREKLNLGGKLMERFHGEFAEIMKMLVENDNAVREKAYDLKGLIKTARSNFNRREYVACCSDLAKFSNAIEFVFKNFTALEQKVKAAHIDFLFKDVDPTHTEYLTNYEKERAEAKEQSEKADEELAAHDQLTPKTAGMSDFFAGFSERGRLLKSWENLYPKFAKKFKAATENVLTRGESLRNDLLQALEEMAGYRAGRKVEAYLTCVQKLLKKIKVFVMHYNKYYNENVKALLESFNTGKSIDDARMMSGPGGQLNLTDNSDPSTSPADLSPIDSFEKSLQNPPAKKNVLLDLSESPKSQVSSRPAIDMTGVDSGEVDPFNHLQDLLNDSPKTEAPKSVEVKSDPKKDLDLTEVSDTSKKPLEFKGVVDESTDEPDAHLQEESTLEDLMNLVSTLYFKTIAEFAGKPQVLVRLEDLLKKLNAELHVHAKLVPELQMLNLLAINLVEAFDKKNESSFNEYLNSFKHELLSLDEEFSSLNKAASHLIAEKFFLKYSL